MGNSESREEQKSPISRTSTNTSYHRAEREASRHASRKAQSHAKPAAPTSTNSHAPAAIVPSSSSASTSTSNTHADGKVTHTRARSITSSAASQHRAEDSASSHKSNKSSYMGQVESKEREGRHRPPSRSQTLPAPPEAIPSPSPSSRPVDVPNSGDGFSEKDTFEPSGVPDGSPYGMPASNRFDRPPRLPLPIEEEPHTPGSPIIAAQDLSSPLDHSELDGVIPRSLSTTTADDEVVDNEFFINDAPSLAPVVPTTINYRERGYKVYVTGTFVNWERKFKLHPDKENGGFSATLQLKPGTHHLKFLVDGDMITSNDLPTTVDYTNILVNYIEVVAPLPQADVQPPAPAEPMAIPGAALTAGQATATGEPVAKPMDIRTVQRPPETDAGMSSTLQETVGPNASVQPTPTTNSVPLPTPTPQSRIPQTASPPPKQRLPRPQYTSEIPAFLTDLDNNNPEDERLQRAKRVEQHLPQPPTLPMFLGKSILNGSMPHKDDASVLLMPNHTVLNHLATSSIKSGVLATSGTTRYKRKFLTTIMYKPTSDDG